MANEIDWKGVEHRAAPRNERRVFVEMDVAPTCGIGEFGQFIQAGRQRVLIYQSERAKLEQLTQTADHRAAWADSERRHQALLAKHVERIKDPVAKQRAIDDFGISPSSIFAELYPGGMPPIKSHRILVDDVPPPETPANVQANQMGDLAKTLAALLGMSGGAQPAKAPR